MTAICHKCIKDAFLKQEILSEANHQFCDECETTAEAITVEDLGKRLNELMREFYFPGDFYRTFSGVDDDRGHDEQHGESLSAIVEGVLGQHLGVHEEIISAMYEADDYRPQDGEEAYWDECVNYVFVCPQVDPADLPDWYGTARDLKHGVRFFSERAKKLFESIFDGIETLTAFDEGSWQPVAFALAAGTKLYRSRLVNSDDVLLSVFNDPASAVGPPPDHAARAGRMNPEGVSVVYAAMDADTCVAEMRPAIGSEVAVISLTTIRELRILDFTRLEKAWKEISFFDPDFALKRQTHNFVKRLHKTISRPVIPGREFDYLITQTMAEYLSCVFSPPFDGIKFGSAQKKGGVNIVLLPGMRPSGGSMEDRFGISYIENSLELFQITEVQIGKKVMRPFQMSDGSVALYSPDDHYEEFEGY